MDNSVISFQEALVMLGIITVVIGTIFYMAYRNFIKHNLPQKKK